MFPSIPRASFGSPAGGDFRVLMPCARKSDSESGVRKNIEEPGNLMDISLNNSEIPNK